MKKKDFRDEKKRLKAIAQDFSMKEGLTGKIGKHIVKTILKDLKNGEILDIGCADGVMAGRLASFVNHITAIDGSEKLIKEAKKQKLSNVDFICVLFEEFQPKKKFDSIILTDILEHISSPVELLKKCREWIKDGGIIIIICPNAYSIHRQIGVLAGMLHEVHGLNKTDLKVGHRRVYDINILSKQIKTAGLKIVKSKGLYLKPLSDSQMENLNEDTINAFYEIGEKLPQELLALLYVNCKKN